MPQGRPPDFNLVLTERTERNSNRQPRYFRIGAAWQMSGGGLSIKLNPGTVLNHILLEEFWLNLYPTESRKKHPTPTNYDGDGNFDDFGTDDIPF